MQHKYYIGQEVSLKGPDGTSSSSKFRIVDRGFNPRFENPYIYHIQWGKTTLPFCEDEIHCSAEEQQQCNIIEYIREQLQHLEAQKSYNEWEQAIHQGAVDALQDVLEHIGATR